MISCSVKTSPCCLSGGLIRPRPPPRLSARPPISTKDRNFTLCVSSSAANGIVFLSPVNKLNFPGRFQCSARDPYFDRYISFWDSPPVLSRGSIDVVEYSESLSPYKGSEGNHTEMIRNAAIMVFFNPIASILTKYSLLLYPCPLITTEISLLTAFVVMMYEWYLRTMKHPPPTDLEFWESLVPVAIAHTVGVAAAAVSLSKLSACFAQILSCGEPVFSVLLPGLFLQKSIPLPLSLSILPIIGGCALASVTELNFNLAGFVAAMISNLAFTVRNILYERAPKEKQQIIGTNYYAFLSLLSAFILAPFAAMIEGPQMWAANSKAADPFWIVLILIVQGISYHRYNLEAYKCFPDIHPFKFITGNTMNKISIIVSCIVAFRTPVGLINALGAVMAITGIFLYSRESCKNFKIKSWIL